MPLKAFAINCSLKSGMEPSSTELLLTQVLDALRDEGVEGDLIRAVDYDIKPGVTSDEGPGDDWPAIRQRVLDADILLLGTPIWLGHPSSVCQRVLERMDAFLGELDDQGRKVTLGRVAGIAVVGNEDGAHHVAAELSQGLSDVGFTIPPGGNTYWVGRAMQKTDYKDLDETPEEVASATAGLARNAAHLARLLKPHPFPGR